jgi:hypothetical protein
MWMRVIGGVVAGLFDDPDENMLLPRLNACGEERAWVYLKAVTEKR